MLAKVAVASCLVATASGFGIAPMPALRARAGVTALSMADKFDQVAPASAPPADLFNIWRDDYMLDPSAAAAEEAERKKNTLFDGVLPPFSQGFNQAKGENLGTPTLQGEGPSAQFSTANIPSTYEGPMSGYIPRKGILPSTASGLTPEEFLKQNKK
eukprot:CAMPEP_0173427838 /NCGR_PEP_ID=MMETSP1357-20121228/6934_1 /TAXON_ID=77926 /ORGANISM="Hemiselmis rufescens, Strain PCC563" /LENGTH=156 /DNA_ID=CAMNT_0014391749 /DNA_START=37 /DNA_END=507 /DNA_ORIENTATION=-